MSSEFISDIREYDFNQLPDVEIGLFFKEIGENEANKITGILAGRKVTQLEFFGCKFSKEALEILSKTISKWEGGSSLIFSDCSLGDEEVRILAFGLKKMKVSRLSLSSNHISDEGAFVLASILEFNPAYSLDLAHNQVGPFGAEALAKNLNSTNLDISYNCLGDEGAEKVAKALDPNGWVKELRLEV